MSIQLFLRYRVYQVDCGDLICCSSCCWEKFPFLFFFPSGPGVQLWIGPASMCRSPEGICSCPDRTGLKEQLIRGLWLTQARGRAGYRMQGEPAVTEAGVTLQQVHMYSPREVVPGSRDPGSGGLHRLPGGEVWIVTCACTLASWWLQQQPYCFMPIWCPMLITVACAHLWSSFRWCSESALLVHPETMVSCLLGSSRHFPGLPSG